ncbi:hypothetical protein ACNOYE_20005 [Nannocystaceae bacterium ST9]
MSKSAIAILVTLALVLACTGAPASDDEAGVTTSPGSDLGDDDLGGDVDEGATLGEDTSTTGLGTSTSGDGDFIIPDDSLLDQCMCDTYQQDCPQGEKCVPFSAYGEVWDCVKCVPVLGDQGVGEVCSSDGIVAGTDDCDASSWCYTLEGEGTCHAFCSGSIDDPECPPGSLCFTSNRGVVNVCLPNCDPLVQNCDDGLACRWDGSNFSCLPIVQNIPAGEPCDGDDQCGLGSQCVDAPVLSECAGGACCSPFCDLTAAEPQCEAAPGTICEVYFFDLPLGFEHVGLCVYPSP